MTRGAVDRTFAWNIFNKVQSISTPTGYTSYTYGADHQRLSKNVAGVMNTIYVGKLYEKVTVGTAVHRKAYVYANGKLVAVQKRVNATPKTLHYAHVDYLGSVVAMTDEAGNLETQRVYKPFGAESGLMADITSRGYTGHEQAKNPLDAEYGLINMNARLYDPEIGRFISADTMIASAGDLQSYNRFSYVRNNPLVYIDPTGHWRLRNFIKSVKQAAIVAVVAYASVQTFGAVSAYAGGGIVGGAIGGAAAGAVSSSSSVALNGGNSSQIWSAARQGAASGALSGVANFASADAGTLGKSIAHGAAGGIGSVMQGGNFRSGFAAGATPYLAPRLSYVGDTHDLLGIASEAFIGGKESQRMGGSFERA